MKQNDEENTCITGSSWLYLHPYVYLSIKKERALLYNTLNHELLEYSKESPIFALIQRLGNDNNLYVIKIKTADIDPSIETFINQIREVFIGDIVDTRLSTKKPIQLKPILNLQKTFQYLTNRDDKPKSLVADEIPDYLNTVTLYLNNTCPQSCHMCQDGYKQFLSCHSNPRLPQELSIEHLQTLLQQSQNSKLFKLNLTGGNLFSYTLLEETMSLLNQIPVLKEYIFHLLNLQEHATFFDLLREGNNKLAILVHFPVSPEILDQQMTILENQFIMKQVEIRFILQNEADLEQAEAIISQFHLQQYRFIPYFNGENLDFFKERIFLTRERILGSQPEMNDLLARTVLNTVDFKKLTVCSDQTVYGNVNHPPVGILGKDHLMEIVYHALHHGRSWTSVRKHVTPCKSCAFNALCPPISNYEYLIGQYNLCHIY